ncbi:hypothetical protein D3C71_1760610 [compost metagenome]
MGPCRKLDSVGSIFLSQIGVEIFYLTIHLIRRRRRMSSTRNIYLHIPIDATHHYILCQYSVDVLDNRFTQRLPLGNAGFNMLVSFIMINDLINFPKLLATYRQSFLQNNLGFQKG